MVTARTSPPGFERFQFVAHALNASGGFAPVVTSRMDDAGMVKPVSVAGECYLVPYPRESEAKYAGRVAVAVYENHLRIACERFVGYLARKPPTRDNVDGPLAKGFVEDADWRGNSLDVFWANFMVDARARGTMLVLLDTPETLPATMAEQVDRRAFPYLVAIPPERVESYELDESCRFARVRIHSTCDVDGKDVACIREWNADGWTVEVDGKVVKEGAHGFGRCPVLAFTESTEFPTFGTFEQIAVLSRRIYNAHSELDEILRSQTFSLLTFQVPADAASTFDAAKVAAVIGTHNMLTHAGETPAFIAPPDGPATVYMQRIAALEAAIRRIGLDIEDTASQSAESGLAKQIRFQALNAALGRFAMRMQDFERQVWDLFAAAVNTENRVEVTWPTDYTLADVVGELDKLTLMQSTGFSDLTLIEKRKQIAAAEFSSVDPDHLTELLDSLDEPAAEPKTPLDPASGTGLSNDQNLGTQSDPPAGSGGAP